MKKARMTGLIASLLFAILNLNSCSSGDQHPADQDLNTSAESVPSQAETPTGEPFQTFTKVGDLIPAFNVMTLDGKVFSTDQLKGKVLVVNLWATWCGPCRQEMPRLEKEVWQEFKSQGLAMVAIAREETESLIADFGKEHGFTFPMAADPERATYSRFADAGIPRTYVVGRDGRILYQSLGYEEKEFEIFKQKLLEALANQG